MKPMFIASQVTRLRWSNRIHTSGPFIKQGQAARSSVLAAAVF